jgi:hypothetical protein
MDRKKTDRGAQTNLRLSMPLEPILRASCFEDDFIDMGLRG